MTLPVVNGLTQFRAYAQGTGGGAGGDRVCLIVGRVVGLVVGAAVGICRSHFSPNHPSLHKQTLFVRHLCQNGPYRPENQNKPENTIILG